MELDPEIKDRTENFFLRTLQEGIQEGMQKGKQEGIQEGMQKGMQEGIQEGIQESLITVACKRFPNAPKSLSASIRCIHGPDRLLALMGECATSGSLKAFTNAVNMTLKQQASMQ